MDTSAAPTAASADPVANQVDTAGTVIQNAVNAFSDYLLTYFLALAAVGALAMALIELWKKLRDSRTRYHARSLTTWMQAVPDDALRKQLTIKDLPRKPSAQDAFGELIHLSTGVSLEEARATATLVMCQSGKLGGRTWLDARPEHALFALELEKMMGHVQDAADVALSSPAGYPSLYLFLTAGADSKQVTNWYKDADKIPAGKNVDRAELKERAALFSHLQQIARRKLDAFQLYTGYRWGNQNIFAANLVGIAVLFAAMTWANAQDAIKIKIPYELMIPLSLLGGILSPLAKDIVVALQKVRQGG